MRILLLGGTAEARTLSHGLAAVSDVALTVSLAGVTARPGSYGGTLRTGGFGGSAGLATYLRQADIGALIDATHPFARQIQRNAAVAAAEAARPALRLDRPPWPPDPAWTDAADLSAALAALPHGARAFLATGRSSLCAALPAGVTAVVRAIEHAPPAQGIELVRGAPAETAEAEATLFRDRGITHLVCRNSGGGATAKLKAAEALGLPVLMIRRPPAVPGLPTVAGVAAAVAWATRART